MATSVGYPQQSSGSRGNQMGEDVFVEITDPQTGKTFFANILTGECTWDKPVNAKVKPKDPNGEWWELFDENHKLPYFYNTKTGETEWLRPQNATIVPLMAIQNSSIGKRVSVALQRASMMGTTTDMPDFASMGNGQNGSSRLGNEYRAESAVQKQNTINGGGGTSNANAYGSSAPMGSSMNSSSAVPMGSSMPEYGSPLQNASPRGAQNSSYSAGSPLGRANTYGASQFNSPGYGNNSGQQQGSPSHLQHQGSQQHLYGGASPYRNQGQQQQPQQQQGFGYQQQQQQQPNQQKSGGYQFGSSPQGGSGSPTTPQNESAWQQAKKFGVGQPVNNPDAAVSMNPFNMTRKGSVAPQQFERPPTLPKDLQAHIGQFRIDGFAQQYFAEHRRGIFRRRVPVAKMLQWQKDTLKLPLMVMNKEYHKEALKCFKLLQRIMGDRGGIGANTEAHRQEIQQLLDKGINAGALRDEIYVQLCKQLSHNPQPESTFRGWQFMCVITIAFPPSKNFEEYLKSFVQQHFGVTENRVDVLSKHAHKKLLRICKVGPRGKTISLQEIERAQEAPFLASVFGETLDDIMKAQATEFPELKLPRILPFLAEAILTLNGCKTEGVFRVPGDVDAVTDLKCRIEKNEYSMAGIADPNVPGSLLKSWLRDLAEPLIPPEHYQSCIEVGTNEMAPDGPRNAARIVEQLPEVNRRVVQYMIRFLRIVGDPQNQPFTKMSVGNLAMVFAPNFLRCPSDSPATIFENTKYEQAWLRILITSNVLG